MIRKDNGSNNSLFLSCQMGQSDGAFFMIKHTPLPNGNHPISSPVCPMGVADTLEQGPLLANKLQKLKTQLENGKISNLKKVKKVTGYMSAGKRKTCSLGFCFVSKSDS